ncbi:hypothetical protein [Geothrix sp. 21YS21S-2]|uniref:hypothetical protein n=1 Tax=Geothrix sp. 21YS21S-2 TaxID=3068893 RepID=UPI0027BA4126|nr:hypothetical protein [Geothrix sp. 21YS21S-2]
MTQSPRFSFLSGLNRTSVRVGLAMALAAGLGVYTSASDHEGGEREESLVRRGFAMVPKGVTLDMRGRNHALVGLGSYIVNTGGCIDCHTHPTYMPGGNPFAGQPEVVNSAQYLSGGQQFGPFTSANLTPDNTGRPAGLSLSEFVNLMRTGVDPDWTPASNRPKLLQVMPWPAFGKKSDRDLAAIYEYLSAIPSLPNNPNPGP